MEQHNSNISIRKKKQKKKKHSPYSVILYPNFCCTVCPLLTVDSHYHVYEPLNTTWLARVTNFNELNGINFIEITRGAQITDPVKTKE